MNQDQYTFKANESYLNFEFESDGPNGRIKKIIQYNLKNADGRTYFNLAFGDWNEERRIIDDTSISDNKDTQKILATVATTVLELTAVYPDMPVLARGSTPARTRLYQMGISANLAQIGPILDVYAFTKEGNWEPFRKGVNYEAFIVWRK